MGIGRTVLPLATGHPIRVSFDGAPSFKAVGAALAWETVAAVASDTVVEGFTVKSGKKYLRYGQVLTKITDPRVMILSVSGTPTGGSFTIGLYDPTNGKTGNITVAYNASVADVQTALRAFYGTADVGVAGSGALPSNVHTITFTGRLATTQVPLPTLASNDLTGGSSPTATFGSKSQTITVTGTPTGGKTVATVVHPTTGVSSAVDIEYNKTAAQLQTALETPFGAGNVLVTGGPHPGTALVVSFRGSLAGQNVKTFTTADAYTGGSAPASAVAGDAGGATGRYGPYDPDADDGRQTLTQGSVFILDGSLVKDGILGIDGLAPNSDQVGVIYGGLVWRARVIANDSANSLASGPTWANLLAAMPEIQPVSG